MAIRLNIYSLYKVVAPSITTYFLIRSVQPEYRNASQDDYQRAIEAAQHQLEQQLQTALEQSKIPSNCQIELIGQMQDYVLGDALYQADSFSQLIIFYIASRYGSPWILLGTADNEQQFMAQLKEDELIDQIDSNSQIHRVEVTYLTEDVG